MKKAILKFNGGNGAVLCSSCSVIVRAGSQLTKEDLEAMKGDRLLPPQYCTKHENECDTKQKN